MVWIDIHKPTGWSLLQNHRTHTHPWPEVKKADPFSKDLLAVQVHKNPKAGAFQLKVGFSLPYPWVSPLKKTHPVGLSNTASDRIF
jgi:hypothetical protein